MESFKTLSAYFQSQKCGLKISELTKIPYKSKSNGDKGIISPVLFSEKEEEGEQQQQNLPSSSNPQGKYK